MAAAADKDYWDEHVKNIATSWLAHGARGAPKAPEEELAQLLGIELDLSLSASVP